MKKRFKYMRVFLLWTVYFIALSNFLIPNHYHHLHYGDDLDCIDFHRHNHDNEDIELYTFGFLTLGEHCCNKEHQCYSCILISEVVTKPVNIITETGFISNNNWSLQVYISNSIKTSTFFSNNYLSQSSSSNSSRAPPVHC